MRTTRILCLLLLFAGAALATESNRIILRVNDRIGTLHDYETRRDDRLRAIQGADLAPAERAELIDGVGAEVMNDMLEEMLVLSRADQIDYRPDAAEIDQAVARARQGFGIETDEQFERALAQSGMNRQAFRKQVEVNMRVSGVLAREVQQRVELSEEDLRRYYYENEEQFTEPERLRLSEIVVLDTSSLSDDDKAALADELRTALGSGSTLSELAEIHKANGNTSGAVDLGWVERGDLDSSLEEAVWSLEAGQVSEAVPGRGGLHVLVVEERQAAELMPFSEVGREIERIEQERLFSQEYAGFMTELREAAYISVRDLPADVKGWNIEQSADRLVFDTGAPDLSLPDGDDQASPSEDESGESEVGSDG